MTSNDDRIEIIIDDMGHLMWWLSFGLLAVALLQTSETIAAIGDSRWVAGCIHGVVAVAFYVFWFRTSLRADSYRRARHLLSAQRDEEQGS